MFVLAHPVTTTETSSCGWNSLSRSAPAYNISDLVVFGNRIWLNFNFSHNLTNLNSSDSDCCLCQKADSCVVL